MINWADNLLLSLGTRINVCDLTDEDLERLAHDYPEQAALVVEMIDARMDELKGEVQRLRAKIRGLKLQVEAKTKYVDL